MTGRGPEEKGGADASTGDAAAASSSAAAAPAKAAAKNFTFLTITDPKQAKDKKNKKSVRSHVMFDFAARSKQAEAEGRTSNRKSTKPRESRRKSVASGDGAAEGNELSGLLPYPLPLTDAVMGGLNQVRDIAESLELRRRSSGSEDSTGAMPSNQDLSRYYRALVTLNKLGSKDTKPQEVVNQDDDTFELVWKAGFVKPYMIRGLGNNIDPFFVLPQFRNPMIYMAELKMWCTRRFGTRAMAKSWVPALARSRFTYLASLAVGATDMDVASGLRGESALTVAVKTEVIEMVNESLADPITQYSDETLMSIDLLLCSEIVTANDWILDIHENGITKILLQRGGLKTLGVNGELAVCVYMAIILVNICREKQPHQLYNDYVALKPRAVSSKRAIPESPVYCPRGDFFTVVRSKSCTEQMYELLSDMRDLTDMLFQTFLDPDFNDKPIPSPHPESAGQAQTPGKFQSAADAYLKSVQELPPLGRESRLSYTASMFEAVRIVSLIYVTAIAKGIPFSEAVQTIDAHCDEVPSTSKTTLPPALRALVGELNNSNAAEAWGDMSGVLYWCVLVGAAAARKRPDVEDYSEEDDWVRKFLTATMVRISTLLCFEHAEPATVALRRLNKVQDLLEKRKAAAVVKTGEVVEVVETEQP